MHVYVDWYNTPRHLVKPLQRLSIKRVASFWTTICDICTLHIQLEMQERRKENYVLKDRPTHFPYIILLAHYESTKTEINCDVFRGTMSTDRIAFQAICFVLTAGNTLVIYIYIYQ